jgi:hypothetical protein
MSEERTQDHISKKRVVYQMPGVDAVIIQRNREFRAADGGVLEMDVYHPGVSRDGAGFPAVVVVAGYPDNGFQRVVGCRFKEMESSISWGRLLAASGIAAITYTNRQPAADLHALLEHVRRSAPSLGIDASRIGMWASSGNVPLALAALMRDWEESLKCAVLCYGYMLDLDGATGVADAARMFGFVNPCAGKSVADLASDIPLFVVRAGRDQMPRLNETLDHFLAGALGCNLPMALVNHADAPHAFELFHDSAESREIVRQILAFFQFRLLTAEAGA